MLKRTLVAGGICLSGLLLVMPVTAQEAATLVLRSGDRLNGELMDLGGVGFTIRVNGVERQIATADVALIEFAGRGEPDSGIEAKLRAGQQLVVLRNGQTIEGRLFDIGGKRPLTITVDTPGGRRDVSSSDVAQVYLASPSDKAVATTGTQALAPGAIRVDGDQPWVDSGIVVRRGDRLTFNATGDIMVGPGASAGPAGTPVLKSDAYPVLAMSAGGLIGKVANSAPFPIGPNTQPITMPAQGRLMLGINDDYFGDNSGFFSVVVQKQGR